MKFDQGFDIDYDLESMTFIYGNGVFGPIVEKRKLDNIRASLLNPDCSGPDVVYSIAMDVGRKEDELELKKRNLLYGAVIYASGQLGEEPIRSQGHIHAISSSCNMSTPEVYEIWSGSAFIYMQESAKDSPGRCFAIEGKPGDVIIVPPGWAHATISADSKCPLVFGAWCVRDYGFDYKDVREHQGLAFFPKVGQDKKITWEMNPNYKDAALVIKRPREYKELNIISNKAIYSQFLDDHNRFMFVAHPDVIAEVWKNFTP